MHSIEIKEGPGEFLDIFSLSDARKRELIEAVKAAGGRMRIIVHHTYYSPKTHLGRKRVRRYDYLYIQPQDKKRVRNVERYARQGFSRGKVPILYAIESLKTSIYKKI